jgi:hypothetical protein
MVMSLLRQQRMHRLAFAALLMSGTIARASDGRDPEHAVRLVAAAGLGQVQMTGEHYGSAETEAGLEGIIWFGPNIGGGLLATHDIIVPWNPRDPDSNLVHYDEGLEPELTLRDSIRRFGHGELSLQGSAGVGMAKVRTMDLSGIHGHEEHTTGDAKEVASTTSMTASVAGAVALRVSWLEVTLGARAQANRAGDWSIGPQLTLGAAF